MGMCNQEAKLKTGYELERRCMRCMRCELIMSDVDVDVCGVCDVCEVCGVYIVCLLWLPCFGMRKADN